MTSMKSNGDWKQYQIVVILVVAIGLLFAAFATFVIGKRAIAKEWASSRTSTWQFEIVAHWSDSGALVIPINVDHIDPDHAFKVIVSFEHISIGYPLTYREIASLTSFDLQRVTCSADDLETYRLRCHPKQFANEMIRRGYHREADVLNSSSGLIVYDKGTQILLDNILRLHWVALLLTLVLLIGGALFIVFRHRIALNVCRLCFVRIGYCRCGYPYPRNANKCPECGKSIVR